MVLGDRNPNRTRLGQRENSLTHTHTWGKAGRSAGCIARPQMYAWNEEVFHCPYHLAQYTHMPTTLLPISFSQIEGNPPADLYVPISPPERVKTCFFSSDLKLKNPRKGIYWYNMDLESIPVQKSWRVTRISFQPGLYVFPWNNKQWVRGRDL